MTRLARDAEIARLDRLAHQLDARFKVLGFRFGWDGLLGLIPGVGDVAAAIPSALILHRAYSLGVPNSLLVRMGVNVALDTVIGSVPLLGSVFDIAYKSNLRNVAMLRRHLEQRDP
ncbi:DUF4112 domain-containing protein [Falsirhodobacter deserti]|uniref:DUF4112 domain-containing protein n=1 Tax=Falsirhodobacter deserti TaxID=1365611 RepID=UPI000FE3F949|nr:DUF4112 domain-containing protein [Falsirhodobacter deserti]